MNERYFVGKPPQCVRSRGIDWSASEQTDVDLFYLGDGENRERSLSFLTVKLLKWQMEGKNLFGNSGATVALDEYRGIPFTGHFFRSTIPKFDPCNSQKSLWPWETWLLGALDIWAQSWGKREYRRAEIESGNSMSTIAEIESDGGSDDVSHDIDLGNRLEVALEFLTTSESRNLEMFLKETSNLDIGREIFPEQDPNATTATTIANNAAKQRSRALAGLKIVLWALNQVETPDGKARFESYVQTLGYPKDIDLILGAWVSEPAKLKKRFGGSDGDSRKQALRTDLNTIRIFVQIVDQLELRELPDLETLLQKIPAARNLPWEDIINAESTKAAALLVIKSPKQERRWFFRVMDQLGKEKEGDQLWT